MASEQTKVVSLVNQTSRTVILNLAPITATTIHLPPRGRINILADEAEAAEIQGGLKSDPPRLAIQDSNPQTPGDEPTKPSSTKSPTKKSK